MYIRLEIPIKYIGASSLYHTLRILSVKLFHIVSLWYYTSYEEALLLQICYILVLTINKSPCSVRAACVSIISPAGCKASSFHMVAEKDSLNESLFSTSERRFFYYTSLFCSFQNILIASELPTAVINIAYADHRELTCAKDQT